MTVINYGAGAVTLTPDTSARNTIQPTVVGASALVLTPQTGQTAPVLHLTSDLNTAPGGMAFRSDGSVTLFSEAAGVLRAGALVRATSEFSARHGTAGQVRLGYSGSVAGIAFGPAADTALDRVAAGILNVGKLAVGNSAAATTPGSVTKKIEVFDGAGASQGFLAVYGAIT